MSKKFTRKSAILLLTLTVVVLLTVAWIGVGQTLITDASAFFNSNILYAKKQLETLNHHQSMTTQTIYAITPTYQRHLQKAELTRISQTLSLVPNIHWILVEDSSSKTELVTNLLKESQLVVTHLVAKTNTTLLSDSNGFYHKGIDQRNAGLKWLRHNLNPSIDQGVVYFMDDDNTYSTKLFEEITKVQKVGVWPVGLVGGLTAETPLLNPTTGKVEGFLSGWEANRQFAIDMAGFAVNLSLILGKSDVWFSYKAQVGYQEGEFLQQLVSREELEPLADFCTKVYVWHTKTVQPVVNGIVDGLEV